MTAAPATAPTDDKVTGEVRPFRRVVRLVWVKATEVSAGILPWLAIVRRCCLSCIDADTIVLKPWYGAARCLPVESGNGANQYGRQPETHPFRIALCRISSKMIREAGQLGDSGVAIFRSLAATDAGATLSMGESPAHFQLSVVRADRRTSACRLRATP